MVCRTACSWCAQCAQNEKCAHVYIFVVICSHLNCLLLIHTFMCTLLTKKSLHVSANCPISPPLLAIQAARGHPNQSLPFRLNGWNQLVVFPVRRWQTEACNPIRVEVVDEVAKSICPRPTHCAAREIRVDAKQVYTDAQGLYILLRYDFRPRLDCASF